MEAIKAETRLDKAGNSNKELRHSGWIPAVVYGGEVNNLPIQVKVQDLEQALRSQTTNKPFKLKISDNEYNVMVYEMQRHPVTGIVLHVDFKQINMNERIHTTVPIVISGNPKSGVANLVRHSLEVSCLPTNIPESFNVDVESLNIGDVISVKDLNIPSGVESDLDQLEVIVTVLAPKAGADEVSDAENEAEGTAETADSPVDETKKV